jgi:hypothetical protein
MLNIIIYLAFIPINLVCVGVTAGVSKRISYNAALKLINWLIPN